jgi:hypothetical protein
VKKVFKLKLFSKSYLCWRLKGLKLFDEALQVNEIIFKSFSDKMGGVAYF